MIPAGLYQPIFLYTVIILTLFAASKLSRQTYEQIRDNNGRFKQALFWAILMAIFIGMRPISGRVFGDTANYAAFFALCKTGVTPDISASGENVWLYFIVTCSKVMSVSDFFTIVDLLYFGLTLFACKRLMPKNVLLAFLFNLAALSFFSYGTNGIRNGLACSAVLLMLSYINGKKKEKAIAIIIACFVLGIHKSTALPIVMSVASVYFIKSFKWAYAFWLLSIVISLTFGNSVAIIFESLGFDDRMSSYLYSTEFNDQFSHTGFRWDFLTYSVMPIILGYYIIIKKGIKDRMYFVLLNTYTLSNAFWVMVIRASFSNRFAYLSWFMYPIVLAYPLFKLNVWDEMQGKRAAQIMLAQVGFTWFMQTFYW